MVNGIKLSKLDQAGVALIVAAFIGWFFGAPTFFAFCLGLGGLLLVYSGFRRFWQWLERRYGDD